MRNPVPKTFWKAYAAEVTRRSGAIATPVRAGSPSRGADPTTNTAAESVDEGLARLPVTHGAFIGRSVRT
jgi:hypothetical protein